LRELAIEAASSALSQANVQGVDAIFVANSYSSTFNSQSQLGPLMADALQLHGCEAVTVEAGNASGGMAIRAAHQAVRSGEIETALVLGVEKVTDIVASGRVKALNVSLDADEEAIHGATLTSLAALLIRRYMHEYDVPLSAFEGFSINAHANGKKNPMAMYRNAIKAGAFANAPMIAEPVSLFDSAPDGDGAAAIVITALERAEDLVAKPIKIVGSAAATDTLALQHRSHPLYLEAVNISANKALAQAKLELSDVQAMELHDAFTILTVLSLEAMGLAERGRGWELAANQGEQISLTGKLPLCTFGGLKSRGNAAGAAGVYQAVEATLQLRGEAGANQIATPSNILIQNIGGLGSTVATHILSI
jgi:acetyl-CoA C-acetyltransferase